jgi:hypothetical protein
VRPTRKKTASQLDAEAQEDPEERWLNAAREIRERIDILGPESPEGRAYDQLEALLGEGSLIDALQRMLRQVRMAESRLAADQSQKRKKENASATSKLRWVASLLERRERRAIADARVNVFMDFTFPGGFIRELPNAIAYFEGDDEGPSARQVIGLGAKSGGGGKARSKLSIRHAVVGRCAEEIHGVTGENCDKPVGILAAMMFEGLKDATATNVGRWRKQWVRAVGFDASAATKPEPEGDEGFE